MMFEEISVDAVAALQKTSPTLQLIDVRESGEYAEGSARGSRSLPLSALDVAAAAAAGLVKDEPIYLICRSGKRSARACEIFAAAGYKKLFNVEGGMLAWEAEDLPLV